MCPSGISLKHILKAIVQPIGLSLPKTQSDLERLDIRPRTMAKESHCQRNFCFTSASFASSKLREVMILLCSETQAPNWLPRGRVAKYFNDSKVDTLSAEPLIFNLSVEGQPKKVQ